MLWLKIKETSGKSTFTCEICEEAGVKNKATGIPGQILSKRNINAHLEGKITNKMSHASAVSVLENKKKSRPFNDNIEAGTAQERKIFAQLRTKLTMILCNIADHSNICPNHVFKFHSKLTFVFEQALRNLILYLSVKREIRFCKVM